MKNEVWDDFESWWNLFYAGKLGFVMIEEAFKEVAKKAYAAGQWVGSENEF